MVAASSMPQTSHFQLGGRNGGRKGESCDIVDDAGAVGEAPSYQARARVKTICPIWGRQEKAATVNLGASCASLVHVTLGRHSATTTVLLIFGGECLKFR